MHACVRCAPPRLPDLAVLLVAVVVALLIALEAPAVQAAGSGAPCQHRARRTTASTPPTASTALDQQTSPTAPSSPADTVAPVATDVVAQDVPADTSSTSWTTSVPASTEAEFTSATAAKIDEAEPQAEVAVSHAPTGRGAAPSTPELVATLAVVPAAEGVPVDDNALFGDRTPPLPLEEGDDAATTPAKHRSTAAPRPPPATAAARAASAAARLQEERARRLEKIQRDLLERKHRRVSRTTTTEPPTEAPAFLDDDLDHGLDDDLEDLLREADEDVLEEERRPSKSRGPNTKQRQDKAGGRLDKHEGAVGGGGRGGGAHHRADPEDKHGRRTDGRRQDGHGDRGDGHRGGQARGQRRGQDDKEHDKRPSKAARRRDSDEDRSIDDNSLSDGSWEEAGGASAADLGDWGGLVCPRPEEVSLLSRQCQSDRDCKGVGEQCCKDRLFLRRCVLGVAPTLPDIPHEPFFGVVARICPNTVDTLVEPWSITNCTNDDDCWPRVCCVDGPYAYCRTPQLEWEKLPGQRFVAPLRLLMSYLQCTPPPPPVFDLFPKSCRNTLDCFPNLCCQERGRKVCRPPKRSLLALLATIGQGTGIFTLHQNRRH